MNQMFIGIVRFVKKHENWYTCTVLQVETNPLFYHFGKLHQSLFLDEKSFP